MKLPQFEASAFIFSLLICMVICDVAWAALAPHLFNCTDDNFYALKFFIPGDWVHHPVQIDHVVEDMNMSHPDTIKRGWSMPKLWMLWLGFIGTAFGFSFLISYIPGRNRTIARSGDPSSPIRE